ncbi:MAG: type II toxin-antitoxin system RelE/ParE family toxin [Alphaproteobacteria bacterium]|nr:type II toxin-antitoxin system RelE/ParE family toxin [Alphaproteobacteria bacterium]
MKVEFTNQAIADLHKISSVSQAAFGGAVARQLESRIRAVIAHIADRPNIAPQVIGRPGMHVFPLVRYPYKIFYRLLPDRVRIVHIRHTARRPWMGER